MEAAVNAVTRGKNLTEQTEVDAMAKAIEDAIAALQYKDADYTKVDAAIAKAHALNKNDYKDFSGVEAAVNAVVRDKNITEQSEVDAMAKSIEDAIAALQYKDADYTKVDPYCLVYLKIFPSLKRVIFSFFKIIPYSRISFQVFCYLYILYGLSLIHI